MEGPAPSPVQMTRRAISGSCLHLRSWACASAARDTENPEADIDPTEYRRECNGVAAPTDLPAQSRPGYPAAGCNKNHGYRTRHPTYVRGVHPEDTHRRSRTALR